MATHQAIIDLIVNGQNEVDRVIRSTDQLQATIARINSRPLELQQGRADQSVARLARRLQAADREVERANAHLNPLRNNFQAVSREAGGLDRALQRNNRSLEANRRQSEVYDRTIRNAANGSREFHRATRALERTVTRGIELSDQRTQLERRRAAVDARMTYQLRQMAGAEEELAQAQERRAQADADVGSARGLQAQIQFANRLADSYMNIGAAQQRAARGLRDAGLDDLAGRVGSVQSASGLRSEIQFFDSLASSVATNSEAFKKFTIASRAASQSLAEVNRNRLAILAEAFTPPDRAVMGPGGRLVEPPITGRPLEPGQRPRTSNEARRGTTGGVLSNEEVSRTRQEVDRLINSFNEVPRSEAGLSDYIERLGELRSVVTFTSEAYRRLAQQQRIAGDLLERAVSLQRSGAMQGPAQFPAAAGPASLLPEFSAQSAEKQARFREKQIADGPFKDRLIELKDLSNQLILNSKRGVQVDQERAEVARLIGKLESGTVEANKDNLKIVSDQVTKLKKLLTLRISDAKVAGTYQGSSAGPKGVTPEQIEGRRQKLLQQVYGIERSIISIQGKGVDVEQARLTVQEQINQLKSLEGKITQDNAQSVARDLQVMLGGLGQIKTGIAEARNEIAQTAKLTGFEKSFESFQSSLQQSRSYFENVSPAEAIDKIVREFNQGGLKSGGDADAVAESIRDSFVVGLKNGIPDAVNAAIQYSKSVIKAFRDSFRAKSPAQEIIDKVVIPIVQAFEKLREFTGRGVAAAKFFAGGVEGGLKIDLKTIAGPRGELSDATTKVGSFVARTSAPRSGSREDTASSLAPTLATPLNTIASIQAEIDELQRKTAGAIENAGTEGSGGLKRRIKEAVESLGDRVRGSLFGGGGAGGGRGLPPSPPTPPGGGPDDFGDRLAAASQQGVQGLLGLAELQKPAEISSARLGILSQVLQEVYSQLDPLAPGAKRLGKELRETIVTLNNIQASNAPDANFLDRITKNPRLSAGISEGLIGGAFPLLFGQGVGASVGGGLGGFAGGMAGGALGFGLSLIGTAVGSAVDTTVNNLKELASSLKEPTAALEAMKTAGLQVKPELEDIVKRMQELGLASSAQALALADLERQLGKGSARQLSALAQEQKKLDEINQKFYAALASEALPLLIGSISVVNDFAAALQWLASIEPPGWVKNLGGAAFEVASKVPSFALARWQFENARERGRRAGEEAKPQELTPELRRQAELAAAKGPLDLESFRLESIDSVRKFSDQLRAAAREQQDLDKQRFELIESYEKSIQDIRLGVERRIQQDRLANLAKENEIYAAQGEIRLQQLRNANAELRASLRGNEFGQQLVDIVAEFTEKQLSAENELANRRRSLETELESRRIEIENYRFDVAKQVSDLNVATERQVASMQLNVLRRNEDYDRGRFDLEKKIALMNLDVKKVENQQAIEGFKQQIPQVEKFDPMAAAQLRQSISSYEDIQRLADDTAVRLRAQQPPAPVSFAGFSAGASVSTAGVQAMAARNNELAKSLNRLRDEFTALSQSGDVIKLDESLSSLADQGASAAVGQFKNLIAEMEGNALQASFQKIDEAIAEIIAEPKTIKAYADLYTEYGKLAKGNLELAQSLEFFNETAREQLSRIDSLKAEINAATAGTTELERVMVDLTQRGLKPGSEEFERLTANASKIDLLQQKLEIINNFKTASSELTLSLRGLIENFYELGSASEAVKRVGEELGRKSLGFVLDIAFKPVEQAMQRTMFDLAGKLGFDIRPEQLQQLQAVQQISANVFSIRTGIDSMVRTLSVSAAPFPGAPQAAYAAGSKVAFITNAGAPNYFDIGIKGQPVPGVGPMPVEDLLVGAGETVSVYQERLEKFFKSFVNSGYLFESDRAEFFGALSDFTKAIRQSAADAVNQIVPGPGAAGAYGTPMSQQVDSPYSPIPGANRYGVIPGAPGQQTNRNANDYPGMGKMIVGPRSSLPGILTGIGGPDMPLSLPVKAYRETDQEINRMENSIYDLGKTAFNGSLNIGASAESLKLVNDYSIDSFNKITETLQQNTPKLQTATTAWGKGLGQVVTGLGLASSAVIGIIGGIQSIQQGGAGNILSGIGSVLTTVGSIGMSVAGFMKPAIPGGGFGAPAGVDFLGGGSGLPSSFQFANGGVLQSPTLFSFEGAGVTRTGQAGEAGPEAIMPLKRTKDGRLGVEADLSIPFEGSSLMVDEEPPTASQGGSSIPFRSRSGGTQQQPLSIPFMKADAISAGVDGSSGGEVIKFESTVINNVEYVTRQEAEQIGRTSAARGAELAQRRIKNNPQVRRSIGMSQ